jgi:DNA (cytosine-5)-methyltransferase 1
MNLRMLLVSQRTPKFIAIDLFCGAGGLTLGFTRAGFDVRLGIDFDPECIKTYRMNFGGPSGVLEDITKIKNISDFIEKHAQTKKIDVLIGGPPCQTFSPVGRIKLRSLRKNPDDDRRNGLWRYFLKFVIELKPLFFVMENVPGMARIYCNGEALPDFIVSYAKKLGFHAEWRILDASDYGVPQRRKRLFIIGTRNNKYIPWPIRKTSVPVTVWEAISDLPIIPHGFRKNKIDYKNRVKLTSYQEKMRLGAGDTLFNHITRWHREDDLIAFSLLPEGGKYAELPPELKRYRDDIFKDKYRKLRRDAPSWTLDAHISKDTYRYIYPSRLGEPEPPRTISVREAARLQSFPDSFIFPEKLTHAFKQIGNSVPPLMAEAVAVAIIRDLND